MSELVSNNQPWVVEFHDRSYNALLARRPLLSVAADPADRSGSTPRVTIGATGVATDLLGTVTKGGDPLLTSGTADIIALAASLADGVTVTASAGKLSAAGGGGVDGTNISPLTVTIQPDHSFTVVATIFGLEDADVTDGGAVGVGHTITSVAHGELGGTSKADDAALSVGDKVVFIGKITAASNAMKRRRGIYTVTVAGDPGTSWVLTRDTGWDQPAEAAGVTYVHVTSGTTYGGTFWYADNSAAAVVFGTTRFAFTNISTNGSVVSTKLTAGINNTFVGGITVKGQVSALGGLGFKDGSTATLGGATTTVTTDQVSASSFILLSRASQGAAPGHLSFGNIVPGVSFDIISSSNTDSGDVAWAVVS